MTHPCGLNIIINYTHLEFEINKPVVAPIYILILCYAFILVVDVVMAGIFNFSLFIANAPLIGKRHVLLFLPLAVQLSLFLCTYSLPSIFNATNIHDFCSFHFSFL